MRVLITGGAGFLGVALAHRLLAASDVERVELLDLAPPPAELADDPRVGVHVGELAARLDDALPGCDAVVHLAAVVSSAAEADFDAGMRTNVDALRDLLDACRRSGAVPRLVFASSLAVFGADAGSPLPDVITDDTAPRPQTSYGVEKAIGEHLVADATRRGWIRGRILRLMTVAVRPGRPNAAASGFVSGIIREPIAGVRATCPVDPDTPLAVASPSTTIDGLLRAITADDESWPWRTAVNLPAMTTTPREMVDALGRLAGGHRAELVDWEVDPAIRSMVATWPARFRSDRAAALGLVPDADVEDLIRQHLVAVGEG